MGVKLQIFQIQRFCLQDGGGIRTTVFLKGCPLDCLWCHNPEGKRPESQLSFQGGRCLQCRKCEGVCGFGVHRWEQGRHVVDFQPCQNCGACVAVCPQKCLELAGEWVEPAWLAGELLKDEVFWRDGGGVTFSGGEPLMQPDGLYETGRLLKKHNCHIAIETSGAVSWPVIDRMAEITDVWLYDFKAGPSAKHKRLCGQGNERILENFRRMYEAGCRIILRYPMIPGINDGEEDFDVLCRMLGETSMEIPLQVMPYHILGKDKARRIGQTYPDTLPDQDAGREYVWRKEEELRKRGIYIISNAVY